MRNVTPCPNWRELLSAYQDQSLSAKDRKRVAAHLQTCDDCRQALAQMDGDRDRFIEAYMAPATKTDLRESVLTALRADAETPAQQPARKFPWGWVFRIGNAVAVVTLILFVAVVMSREPKSAIKEQAVQNSQEVGAAADATGDAATRTLIRHANGHSVDETYNNRVADAYDSIAVIRTRNPKIPQLHSGRIYYSNDADAVPTDNGPSVYGYDVLAAAGGAKNSTGDRSVVSIYDGPLNSNAAAGLLVRSDDNLKLAYDIDYHVQVKNALQKSRQAQGIITGLGGFTMNYQYVQDEHEPAVACFNGKIPADKAEAALAQIEKLGNVRGLTIAGEDLTEQFQANRQEIARQLEHAKKLDAIGSRSASKVAAGVESQRNDAKGQVDAAKQALTGLTTRHELVTISAAFYEAQPREPLTLARATAGTRHVLNYALLLLVTIAVFFLLVALVAAPFVGLRYWRRRRASV